MESKNSLQDDNFKDTITVTDVKEFEDGSAEYTFDIGNDTMDLLMESGMKTAIKELDIETWLPQNYHSKDRSEQIVDIFFCVMMRQALTDMIESVNNEKNLQLTLDI